MAGATLTVPPQRVADSVQPNPRSTYTCECGHALRVSGGGRHRVYFELGGERLDEPVMSRLCSACGRGLPGKNAVIT
jgi:hypothetical protein